MSYINVKINSEILSAEQSKITISLASPSSEEQDVIVYYFPNCTDLSKRQITC